MELPQLQYLVILIIHCWINIFLVMLYAETDLQNSGRCVNTELSLLIAWAGEFRKKNLWTILIGWMI